jgi:organic radical activating enzyme
MMPSHAAERASISEIFSSIQGEGIRQGERHLFIRFFGCSMHCRYCDERSKPGFEMTLEQVLAETAALERKEGHHDFASLTGGEPLLQVAFLKILLPELRRILPGIYLETNGVLWPELMQVIDDCDVIAMDMKPASVTGDRDYDSEHRRFLELAAEKDVFVKMTVSPEIDFGEFDREIQMVADIAPQTPVVLQPVSSGGPPGADGGLSDDTLALLRIRAGRILPDVRVVGRLHKILNIR